MALSITRLNCVTLTITWRKRKRWHSVPGSRCRLPRLRQRNASEWPHDETSVCRGGQMTDDIVAELERWLRDYPSISTAAASLLMRARDEIVQLRAEVIDREGQRDALLNALRNARAEPCHGPDDRWCPVCG